MSTRVRLVELLESEAGVFVSGAELARRLGMTRAAVWKQIEALRKAGYVIDGARSRGYRLTDKPDVLDAVALGGALCTRWLGRHLVCLPVTGSTNSDAAARGRSGDPHGTVVVADAQTAGRGRLGRSWVSVRGVNVYLSALLRPAIVPAAAPQLSLVAGVAVARALEADGHKPQIKWPNDVLLEGRKVCGILTEIEAEADRVAFVVVGIGVNVNSSLEHFPPELHDRATSVYLAAGRRTDRVRFVARLLSELERCYERYVADGFSALAPEWNERAALTGRRVTVSGAGEPASGVCVGIDADGALVLEDANGDARRVIAGDVTVEGGYA